MRQYHFILLVTVAALCLLISCGRNRPLSATPTPSSEPIIETPTTASSHEPHDRTGQLLKSDSPAIYRAMEDGTLRHIPTWADFVGLGFEGAEVITLADDELADYTLGPPLTQDSSAIPSALESDPLHNVISAVVSSEDGIIWLGTAFAGLYACPWTDGNAINRAELPNRIARESCRTYTTFNSNLLDNAIHALAIEAGNTLWVASPGGLSTYADGLWEGFPLATGATTRGALSLAVSTDGTLWVGGDGYIAYGRGNGDKTRRSSQDRWTVHTAIDQPLLNDAFTGIEIGADGHVVFSGNKRQILFDGTDWRVSAPDGSTYVEFQPDPLPPEDVTPPPLAFPNPQQTYQSWLQTWPRPPNDNGRCMHFVQLSWLDVEQAQRQIQRLVDLDVRWTVVPYANHFQLRRLAPLFAEVGIIVIWRPFVRPYEAYEWWKDDMTYLRTHGHAPYMQLYNEPSLAQEWDIPHSEDDPPIDQAVYLSQLAPAIRTVYNAGGYVGLQFLDLDWTRDTLKHLKESGMSDTFDRLFFIPHPYGLNHPPAYDEDESSVLGFRTFGQIFAEEIGFVPMMVAGEGGWRPGEEQDDRYPPVSAENHRDYHVEVFEWFRRGGLSNGEPLPDYLFAFCPWLIADPIDSAGWFDSRSGDRSLTIEAVQALPPFERRFSWE